MLAAEGIEAGDLGVALVGPDGDARAQAGAPRIDEPTDVLSFPIDGKDELRRACRASSATSSSARRSSARSGSARSSTACCTCSATTTARRWSAARQCSAAHERDEARAGLDVRAGRVRRSPPRPRQPRHGPRELDDAGSRRGTTSIIQSFNYAFEGVIWTLRTQRNMRIHFAVATIVLVLAVRLRRHEARADRAPARDRIRPDHGDGQHRHRGCHGHRDDVVQPARQAREGHRRGRGPRRLRERDRRSATSCSPTGSATRPIERSSVSRRADPPHADRARRRDPARHRAQGHQRPRHPAARRPAVRARRARVRRLGCNHASSPTATTTASSCRRSPSSWPCLVAQTRVESGIHSTLEVAVSGRCSARSRRSSSSRPSASGRWRTPSCSARRCGPRSAPTLRIPASASGQPCSRATAAS